MRVSSIQVDKHVLVWHENSLALAILDRHLRLTGIEKRFVDENDKVDGSSRPQRVIFRCNQILRHGRKQASDRINAYAHSHGITSSDETAHTEAA
jgi:hypothetical protein